VWLLKRFEHVNIWRQSEARTCTLRYESIS
jgi:hypothetical protein